MITQNDSNVRGALIDAAQRFLTTGENTVDADAIAWENRTSNASESASLWVSVFYVPNQPESRTIGLCGRDRVTGFLQIDFNAAQGQGEQELNAWENEGREFFAHGNRFSLENVSVLVTASGMLQGRHVDNHFRRSFQVDFQADLIRKTTPN